MIEVVLKNMKNNKHEWWLYEDKESLSIDRHKKVTLLNEDKFLENLIFI